MTARRICGAALGQGMLRFAAVLSLVAAAAMCGGGDVNQDQTAGDERTSLGGTTGRHSSSGGDTASESFGTPAADIGTGYVGPQEPHRAGYWRQKRLARR
ncbi:hypothetical protein ACFL5O_02170 [Myxococcota bacterium]